MSFDKKKFLVLLPTLNEENHLASMVSNIRSLGYDIILSDGGSSDNTINIGKDLGINIVERSCKGKGCAVQDGLKYANINGYEHLVLIDCDSTYPEYEIDRLAIYANNYDMVVGERDYINIQILRRMANRLMNLIISILYFKKVFDMASGLRILRVSKFLSRVTATSFDIEPQIHSLALRHNFKIKGVKINYIERKKGSKSNFKHLLQAILILFKERFRKIN